MPNDKNPPPENPPPAEPDFRVSSQGGPHQYLVALFLMTLVFLSVFAYVRRSPEDCWRFLGFAAALLVSPEAFTAALRRRFP